MRSQSPVARRAPVHPQRGSTAAPLLDARDGIGRKIDLCKSPLPNRTKDRPPQRMGVVWDTFAAFLSARWHFWHPLLVMGVVWDTFAADSGRRCPVWHPSSVMGVVRAVLPTAPAPKRPMCTGCVFARTLPRLGPDGGPPAAGSRLRLAPRRWPSRPAYICGYEPSWGAYPSKIPSFEASQLRVQNPGPFSMGVTTPTWKTLPGRLPSRRRPGVRRECRGPI